MAGCFKLVARFCLLLVLVLWATQDLGAKKKPPLHPVNLNTANSEQLQEVPGIGPATADKILQARKSYGTFKSVDDLEAIKGIGPKRLDKMRRYLTVNAPAPGQNKKAATDAAAPEKKKGDAPATTKIPPPATCDEEEQ